jgi:fructose-bisphosphate aldolase class I
MRPIDTLGELMDRATRHRIFGTRMRSVIKDADKDGVTAIVDQQFGYGAQVSAAGLVPIIEPEVSNDSPRKDEAETLLRDALQHASRRCPTTPPSC